MSGRVSMCNVWSSKTVTFSRDISSTGPKFRSLYSGGMKTLEVVDMDGRAGRDHVGVAKVQPTGGRNEVSPKMVW